MLMRQKDIINTLLTYISEGQKLESWMMFRVGRDVEAEESWFTVGRSAD